MPQDFPRTMNLGSGKNFRNDCINLDINDYWSPDIVADICKLFAQKKAEVFSTDRFGSITLSQECLDRIICNDVLEHVPDLVAAMTTCLHLLRNDGEFEISVPYDLSYGAWQDPTHLRAFNERSWLYYTDWFWYLGWTEARFHLTDLMMGLSPLGHNLQRQGYSLDVLAHSPRAIDSMKVTLVKKPLTNEEKSMLNYHRSRGSTVPA